MNRGAWQAIVHGVTRVRRDLVDTEREKEFLDGTQPC